MAPLSDEAPVLLASLDAQQRYRYANANYARWLGCPVEALLGRPMREVLGEAWYALVAGHVAAALEGRRADFEVELPPRDGVPPRHARVCYQPHLGPSGAVEGFGALVIDLTSHRRAEERTRRLQSVTAALAEATSLAQCAQAVLTHGVEALGGAGGLLLLVDEARGVLDLVAGRGYSEALLEAWRHTPLEAPVPLAEAARLGEPLFLGSREETVARCPLLAPTLAQTHLEARAVLPLMLEGRVLGVVGVSYAEGRAFDAEDRALLLAVAGQGAQALGRAQLYERERQAREEAQALAARLKVLAEASRAFSAQRLDVRGVLQTLARQLAGTLADGCVLHLLSPEGDVLVPEVLAHVEEETTAALREALVCTPLPAGMGRLGEVLHGGRSLLIPEVDVERLRAACPDLFQRMEAHPPVRSLLVVPLRPGGSPMGVLSLVRTRPGHPFTLDDQLLAEDVADRAALAIDNARAYAREREARARAEAAARQAELLHEEARRAVRVRDEFLSVASHELRTPLTPLALRTQVLARELAAGGGARAGAHLEVMQRQVRKLADLVEGLLDVSRIGAGRLELQREPVDLAALVRDVAARHEHEAQRAGCPLVLELPAEAVGQWDRLRLEQVVVNLLTNALKYGAGRPVRLSVAVEAARARLCVSDGGIGVAPGDVARIFERFERAVSGRNYGGLGLGLYICRQIVDALGGSIAVDSRPGEGARFTVELPRA